MRAARIVMLHPCLQNAAQVVLGQRNHEVQAFAPQRAQEPFAKGIRLGSPHRGFEHSQPQMTYTLVKLS